MSPDLGYAQHVPAIIMPTYPATMDVTPPTTKENAVRMPILKSQPACEKRNVSRVYLDVWTNSQR